MFKTQLDLTTDNFISYAEDFTVKQEKLSDADVALTSTFSADSDSTAFYPSFISPSLRTMLETNDLTIREPLILPESATLKRPKPFKIIRVIREASADSIKVKIEPEKKLITNTRREHKREIAKKKTLKKMEVKSPVLSCNLQLTPESLSNLNLDEKTGKKMLQMIRNRISAQNSRDRRRNYLQTLEQSKEVLLKENLALNVEKSRLLEEMNRLKESNTLLQKRRRELLKQSPIDEQKARTCLEQFDIGSYLNNLGLLNFATQKQKQGMGMAFSLGLLLSVAMMMRINEQNALKLDAFELQKQAKLGFKLDNSLLLELEEKGINTVRKCSQSTTMTSYDSPPPFGMSMMSPPHEIRLPNAMAFINDEIDDGWAGLGGSTLPFAETKGVFPSVLKLEPELQNKDFELSGNDLMSNLQGSLNHLKSLKAKDAKRKHLDFELLKQEGFELEI